MRAVLAGGNVVRGACSCIVLLGLCLFEEILESHNAVH